MKKICNFCLLSCFVLLINTNLYCKEFTDFIAKRIFEKYGEAGILVDEVFEEKGRYLFEKHEALFKKLCNLIDKDSELGKSILLYYQDIVYENIHDEVFINALLERFYYVSKNDRKIIIETPSLFYLTIYDKSKLKNTYRLLEKNPELAEEILFYLSITSSESEIENLSLSILKYSEVYEKYGVWASDYFSINSRNKEKAADICYLIYKNIKDKNISMEIISRNYDDIFKMILDRQIVDERNIEKVCYFVNSLSENELNKIFTSNYIFRFFNENNLKYINVYKMFEKLPDMYFVDILYENYNENDIMKESFLTVISESEYYSYYLQFFYENSGNNNLKQILSKQEYIGKYDNKMIINEYVKKLIEIYYDEKDGGRNKLMNRIIYFESLRGTSFYRTIFDVSPGWIEYAPGYDAFKLVDKSIHGEDVSAGDVFWGVFDAADIVLTVATLGTGSVITKSIKNGGKVATKEGGKKIIKEIGEEGIEKVFKNSKNLANVGKKGKGIIKTVGINNSLFKGLDITKQVRNLDIMLKNSPFRGIRKNLLTETLHPRIINRGDRKVILKILPKTLSKEVRNEVTNSFVGIGLSKFVETEEGANFIEKINKSYIKGRELYEEMYQKVINY